MSAITERQHPQTLGEDIANSISHGFGAASIVAASPFLLVTAFHQGGALAVVCASIFASTVLLLYLASTVYHALRPGRAKRALRLIDHSAIFLLIAGTYTPFALGVLRGPWGWSLFGTVWGLAVLGVFIEVFSRTRPRRLSLILYLVMGWLVLIAIVPLVHAVPSGGLVLLLCGGLAYTVGIVFYTTKRLPYAHLLWHLFVVAGTTLHFFAVLNYAV